jgi:putative transposase
MFRGRVRRVKVKRGEQLRLPRTAGWGGRRKGAGRRRDPNSGVMHIRRRRFRNMPVHITLRVLPHVWNLRSKRCFRAIGDAFAAGREKFGARLCHWSVQGNHIHLIVEGHDAQALSRAMQGLEIRIAKALNRVMGRSGKVFADRYHAHVLRTPREVQNALHYVLGNHAVHARRAGRRAEVGVDAYSSRGYRMLRLPLRGEPMVPARTWLLRRAVE